MAVCVLAGGDHLKIGRREKRGGRLFFVRRRRLCGRRRDGYCGGRNRRGNRRNEICRKRIFTYASRRGGGRKRGGAYALRRGFLWQRGCGCRRNRRSNAS